MRHMVITCYIDTKAGCFNAPFFIIFIPKLWGGFVMRERSKKYRLENPEKPRYVKYMYYANASDDKTAEVLNNDCRNLNIEAGF
jgi:NhaP-type Na+/H+ and K+/H+ antiporter